jgi:VCBS repeat-containing protein
MHRSKSFASLILITLLLWVGVANSTILVVAPHPDDDLLIAAGVTYAATQRGEQVTTVFMTNGDYFGRAVGDTRQDEAVNAQISNLGTVENHLIFLGYPDGGLEFMYNDYPLETDQFLDAPSGQTATYAHRGLGAMDYHSYRFGSPANYNGFNLRKDLQDIINSVRPDHIITVGEFDQHSDHFTTFNAVRAAVMAVTNADPSYVPVLNKSMVWSTDSSVWPNVMNPKSYFSEPPGLASSGVTWADRESLDVPLEMQVADNLANLKVRAINDHVSQEGINGFGGLLGSFVHKDEFFWPVNVNGVNHPPRVDAGLDKTASKSMVVTLDGSLSSDPDSTALTYQWRQIAGPTMTLSGANTATPGFTTPASVPVDLELVFELVVSDGSLHSLPDHVSVYVSSNAANIAPLATVSASSQDTSTSQLAVKAIDGFIDGAWGTPGDYTREWATAHGGAGSWLELNWDIAYQVNRIVLYDRPNPNDQITSATLTFSDGSTVNVGTLENWGSAVAINVTPKTTNQVKLTITTVSGTTENVGLSEIQVYGVSATSNNLLPVGNAGPDQTVAKGTVVSLDGSASSDPTNQSITYKWTQTQGPNVSLTGANTATPSFTAPLGLPTDTILTFALVVNDGQLNSIPDTVNVTVTSNAGANIAALATVSASSQDFNYNQLAIKAVDGIVDGAWGTPGDYTREWATLGEGKGAWIQLNWNTAYQINSIVLYDRPNPNDQIVSATLTFSDGSTVNVGTLENWGSGDIISFAPRISNRVRLSITTVSGTTQNVGLSEIKVYAVLTTGNNPLPIANAGPDQTLAEGLTVALDGSASSDPNNNPITYQWTQTQGPSVTLTGAKTATPGFLAPTVTSPTILTFTLVVNDGQLDSIADSVDVVVNPAGNTAPSFVGGATSLTILQNSAAINLKDNLHVSDKDIGQTLTWSKSTSPLHGTLTASNATASSGSADITPGGTITYKPTAGYSGTDTFAVKVSDGVATTIRVFSVNVVGNTVPSFVGGSTSLTVSRNSAAVSLKDNLHVSDIDIGQTLTWSKSTSPLHGTLTASNATASSGSADITPGGTITYKPRVGYIGIDSFSVKVSDGVNTVTRIFTVLVI